MCRKPGKDYVPAQLCELLVATLGPDWAVSHVSAVFARGLSSSRQILARAEGARRGRVPSVWRAVDFHRASVADGGSLIGERVDNGTLISRRSIF